MKYILMTTALLSLNSLAETYTCKGYASTSNNAIHQIVELDVTIDVYDNYIHMHGEGQTGDTTMYISDTISRPRKNNTTLRANELMKGNVFTCGEAGNPCLDKKEFELNFKENTLTYKNTYKMHYTSLESLTLFSFKATCL